MVNRINTKPPCKICKEVIISSVGRNTEIIERILISDKSSVL